MTIDHPVHTRVLGFIRDAAGEDFGTLALEVFAHQFACIPAYRRVCERRGFTPAVVDDWRQIPAVPTLAFKHIALHCAAPERQFVTSGTTRGSAHRGVHAMPDLRLYHAAAVSGLRAFVFPDVEMMRVLSLVPAAEDRPESSLAQMVAWAIAEIGSSGSATFVVREQFDFAACAAALRESESSGVPVCLMATTAALMRFLDHCGDQGWSFRLPHGSRLMDTGGSKGTARVLSRNGLLQACWRAFAIPGYFMVNEYGMTELASQFYDTVIRDRTRGRFARRVKAGPHWVRTRALDPATLADVAEGAPGVLCHTDLANAGTALVVLTEDVGRLTDGGFEILGRVAGAEARGCSLSAAEFGA
jgi:hypothetical protein